MEGAGRPTRQIPLQISIYRYGGMGLAGWVVVVVVMAVVSSSSAYRDWFPLCCMFSLLSPSLCSDLFLFPLQASWIKYFIPTLMKRKFHFYPITTLSVIGVLHQTPAALLLMIKDFSLTTKQSKACWELLKLQWRTLGVYLSKSFAIVFIKVYYYNAVHVMYDGIRHRDF